MKKILLTIGVLFLVSFVLIATDITPTSNKDITLSLQIEDKQEFGVYYANAETITFDWSTDTTTLTTNTANIKLDSDGAISFVDTNATIVFWWKYVGDDTITFSANLTNLAKTGDATAIPLQLSSFSLISSGDTNVALSTTNTSITSSTSTYTNIASITKQSNVYKSTANGIKIKAIGLDSSAELGDVFDEINGTETATMTIKVEAN